MLCAQAQKDMTQRGWCCLWARGGDGWLSHCSDQLSAVTSARSPCSLRLPRPQSHSSQRSPVSHARRSLGKGGGAGISFGKAWDSGTGPRERGQGAPGRLPLHPTHRLSAPLPRDTEGRGEKAKPEAGDDGLATIQRRWSSTFSLAPQQAWRGGAAGGRGLGEGHMHPAQCGRFKKSLEP